MVSFASALLAAASISAATALNITVSSSGGNATSPLQYGIMHEDINNGGDGGAYAELIQNRALQASAAYPVNLDFWQSFGGAALSVKQLANPLSSALPNSINVAVPASASGQVGLANEGFWGIDVQVQQYTGSFWVKGSYKGNFTAWLRSNLTSDVFGSVQIASAATPDTWVQHNVTLTPTKAAPNSNNTFAITFDAAGVSGGSLDFNLVSLFPPTYKNRPNGNRIDIMNALAELKPKFFRLPGGNMLEGNTNSTFWMWNNTIGPLKDRPGFPGVWGYEVTQGQGIVEYLNWATDLGAKPSKVLSDPKGRSLRREVVR
jgi:alpha-L-arabinofuranosidase